MNKVELEKARAYAQGATKVNGFKGIIPGPSTMFEEGDVFTLPFEYEVFEERVGMTTNQFIFVETKQGVVRKLYPSQFIRKVREVDMKGKECAIVTADGTASQLYKRHATVEDGMNALRGKTIMVLKVTWVNTVKNSTDLICRKPVYTFDLV